MGTTVILDNEAKFLDRDLLAGGAPWRLLHLPGGSRSVAERWVGGGVVGAGEERFARTLVQQGLLHPLYHGDVNIDDVDVIIPVRDDVASLRSLLTQLVGLHVTVIDDGSTHSGLVSECAGQFGVELIRLQENHGPAGARNAGFLATSRNLLWFIDVDVVIDNATDVLARLSPKFADPLLGAIAPRVCGGAGSTMRDDFERRFGPLDMGPRSGLVIPGGPVGYVPSACLLVRRSAFGEGFDEMLRVGEDVDFVWRLSDQGWLAERYGARVAPVRTDTWTLLAWLSVLASKPAIGARIVRVARRSLRQRLASNTDDPDHVANEVVTKGMLRAGGPLARSVVRTFGPLVLLAALHPRLRRKALFVFALGTAWRWRRTEFHASDVPLAVADDLAYSVGVGKGAWSSKSLKALTPHIVKSSLSVRELLGLKSGEQT
jgi:hypothetical protein